MKLELLKLAIWLVIWYFIVRFTEDKTRKPHWMMAFGWVSISVGMFVAQAIAEKILEKI